MGEIPDNSPEDLNNMSNDGEVAEDEDGRQSFGSNICDGENNNFGDDLEDDL